jgi:hypothetical protein
MWKNSPGSPGLSFLHRKTALVNNYATGFHRQAKRLWPYLLLRYLTVFIV